MKTDLPPDEALRQLARESAPECPPTDQAFRDLRDRIALREQAEGYAGGRARWFQPLGRGQVSSRGWGWGLGWGLGLSALAMVIALTALRFNRQPSSLAGDSLAEGKGSVPSVEVSALQPSQVIDEVIVYFENGGILMNNDEETGWIVIDAIEI